MAELCKLLKLSDTKRNRDRISEAMIRFKIRPKIRPYTREVLIDKLKAVSKQLGRTPNIRELDKLQDAPGKGTYMRFFGSWGAAKKAAGLV